MQVRRPSRLRARGGSTRSWSGARGLVQHLFATKLSPRRPRISRVTSSGRRPLHVAHGNYLEVVAPSLGETGAHACQGGSPHPQWSTMYQDGRLPVWRSPLPHQKAPSSLAAVTADNHLVPSALSNVTGEVVQQSSSAQPKLSTSHPHACVR